MSAEVTVLVPTTLPSSSTSSTVRVVKMSTGSVTVAVKSSSLSASTSLAAIHARQARITLAQRMNTKYMTPPRQPVLDSRLWRMGR